MQTATSKTESKSRILRTCVRHYTLRAPCPKEQGKVVLNDPDALVGRILFAIDEKLTVTFE